MKKLVSVLCAVVMIISSCSFAASAAVSNDGLVTFEEFKKTRFDADGSGATNAADARETLRASAGLKNNVSIEKADVDGDGIITAIDARLILRIAANIDISPVALLYFNDVINTVKPNKYNYYAMPISSTDNVTYVDKNNVIKSLDEQVNDWEWLTHEHMDLGKELTQTETTYSSFLLNRKHNISNSNFPIFGQEYASTLMPDNIIKADYKENQTYTYTHYDRAGVNTYSESVEGLDSITVYVKPDSMTSIPEDINTLNNGRVFNVLEQSDVDAILKSSGLGSMSGMEEMGKFDISPKFDGVKYYDSYVTVYFDHGTGAVVGVDYNFHYDVSITLSMDINVSATGEDGHFFSIKAKGDVNLTSTMTEKNSFYITDNNPSHVPAE